MPLRFRVKICGLVRHIDVVTCVNEGVDAIGINFCVASPRHVDLPSATQLLRDVPSKLLRIGVFADPPGDLVKKYAEQLGLNAVQLHGDEVPQILNELPQIPVIKAVRVNPNELPHCRQQLQSWIDFAGDQLAGVLLDASKVGQLGGTGVQIPSHIAWEVRNWVREVPVILAGGLNPENVHQAICDVRPDSVDSASGVERSPGVKDPERVQRFVRAAKKGWDDVASLAKRG
jgi:phosphoribosylanthranilate isomerase